MKNRQDNINDYQSLYKNITEALKEAIGIQPVGVTNKRKESKQTKTLRQDKNKLKRDLQSAIQRKDPEKTTILKKYINSQKILREQLENEIREQTRDLADNKNRRSKGKGKKGKCSNERGITMANNFGKIFERMVNNRITPTINMTESHAGGQKGKATVDHLHRLKNTITHIRQNRKDAYIAFLDVTKAYDKAWLDAILYVMHKEGTDLPTWKLVKELSSNLKATLKTKHGNTRQINIEDSIRQGGVLSVIQYALLMDDINKEIIKADIGPKYTAQKDWMPTMDG